MLGAPAALRDRSAQHAPVLDALGS
jgi:hypothetical protein